jgi:hypothetical protein
MLQWTFRSLVLVVALLPGLAAAEIIKIPVGQQQGVDPSLKLPARGLSANLVKQRYGEPAKAYAAVGTPPISRWEYSGFAVYFEYDHVVHAVRLTMAKNAQ